MLHEVWVPRQFIAAGQQLIAQFFVASTVADIPLPTCHNLERSVTFFIKLDGVRYRARFFCEFTSFAQHLDSQSLRLLYRLASEPCILRLCLRRHHLWCLRNESAVATNRWSSCEIEFTPPNHVSEITERANHRDTRTFVGLRQWVWVHRHFDAKNRCDCVFAKQMFISSIVGVGDKTDARSD